MLRTENVNNPMSASKYFFIETFCSEFKSEKNILLKLNILLYVQ